jgi:hypothetical protein
VIDPKNMERAGRGAAPFTKVEDSILCREWIDAVRGRVGSSLHVSWNQVRSATRIDLKALYESGMSRMDAAAMIVRRWSDIPVSERERPHG